LFRVTPPAREFLLKEGTDMKYGARHLKRAIERHVVYPLASLLSTEQVSLGDVISIDWREQETGLKFLKEVESTAIAAPSIPRFAGAIARADERSLSGAPESDVTERWPLHPPR
jgi:hypothetical protein